MSFRYIDTKMEVEKMPLQLLTDDYESNINDGKSSVLMYMHEVCIQFISDIANIAISKSRMQS